MRVLISRITVSASGRLTEPLKWTLLGGIPILSFPGSRLRPRSQHTVHPQDRREPCDPAP